MPAPVDERMEVYRRYGPALLRKAERMLQSREEAQDLVHGLFVDLLQRGGGALDLPYLYRAVTNRCLNHLRDRSRQGALLAAHDGALRGVARTRLDDRVVDRQLLSALAGRLDAATWEILVCHFVDDMSQDEIAAVMRVSRKTVVRRLRRIRDEVHALAAREAER